MTWKKGAAFFAVSLLWGSGWIVASGYQELLPPFLTQALCFALAAALLALLMLLRRIPFPRGRAFYGSVLLGLTMATLPSALVHWAGDRVSGGLVVVLFAFMPLLAVFAPLLFSSDGSPEASSRARNAVICGMGGVALLVSGALSTSPAQIPRAAVILAVVAVQALSLVYAKKRLAEVHPLATATVQLATGAVLLAILSMSVEHAAPWQWKMSAFLPLLLSAIASGIALSLLYWLLQRVEPHQAATLQWSQSLVAVAEAALLLHERPPLTAALGAVVVLGSLIAAFVAQDKTIETLTLKVTPHLPHD